MTLKRCGMLEFFFESWRRLNFLATLNTGLIQIITLKRQSISILMTLKSILFWGNGQTWVNHAKINSITTWFDTSLTILLPLCIKFQVESITIGYVECGSCMKLILNALGPALKSLHFENSHVDLAHLLPCSSLERLTIGNERDGCTVINDVTVEIDSLIALPYLPALKTFVSYACLEEWSPLFESKPKLTELRLNSCCHIRQGVIIYRNP